MAQQEAKNNEGMPAIYAIAEVIREWLSDHNQPGLDDASMHAQMIRKQKDQAKQKEVRPFVASIVVARTFKCCVKSFTIDFSCLVLAKENVLARKKIPSRKSLEYK